MKRASLRTVLCALMCAVCLAGCADKAEGTVEEGFVRSQMDAYVKLFKASARENREGNLLISPLSVQVALDLAANGAAGETKAEMEKVLGGMAVSELNQQIHSYISGLPSEEKCRLKTANSIWIKDNEDLLKVKPEFLRVNERYYDAQARLEPFDSRTVERINGWVKDNTEGMIDRIIERIDPDAMMYLINAVSFEADWSSQYSKENVGEGSFTAASGEKRTVEMMSSLESKYIRSRNASGFIKDYAGGKYGFAVLLPNQNIDIYDYVAGLDADSIIDTLQNAQERSVRAFMPKFSCDFDMDMKEILIKLGMPTAFSSGADFSDMTQNASGSLGISKVLHKTYISVAEQGTRAGAVTEIAMTYGSASESAPPVIRLDRPFVYMIIDNAACLPVFMGILADTEG